MAGVEAGAQGPQPPVAGFPALVLALLLLAWTGPAAARDKTDVVYLRNGDRVTCEIKNLEQPAQGQHRQHEYRIYRMERCLRRELITDLFIELSVYDSYDSKPPEDGTENDYGIVTSLGYTF